MNKIIAAAIIASLTIFTSPALSIVMPPYSDISLNRVTLQLSAEQWATTTTARVIIGIDATVKEIQLNKLRTDILTKLDHLTPKATWNITRFDRTESTSGLAQIRIEAETRVPEEALGSINEKAKTLSKAGETFHVLAIDFSPSLPELEKIRSDLRAKILSDVKTELERLNKTYTDQKYYVHDVQFNYTDTPIPLMATADLQNNSAANKNTSIAVSNKITLTAMVTLASTIKPAS